MVTAPMLFRVLVLAALTVLGLLAPAPRAAASRDDTEAADLYDRGRRLIGKGKFKEGADLINRALARGATEPNDQQGGQSRYMVRRYDPYYWLGVAQMEMRLDEQALRNFEKSLSMVPAGKKEALIKSWPEEYADLKRRMDILLKRLEAPVATPPVLAAGPTPSPTPVLVAAARTPPPTAPPPPPAPTATPFAIQLHGRTPAPPPATSPARPTRPPEAVLAEQRRAGLTAALEALSRRDWNAVSVAVASVRRADPASPEADLVEAGALATRYVLEGKRDRALLDGARRSLAAWKAKAPGRTARGFLSPALRTLLDQPAG